MAKSAASFKPGTSGNKAGRPSGTTHRSKFRAMITPDLPAMVQTLVTAAKGGDLQAIKIVLDRTIPTLKPTSDALVIKTTGSLAKRGEAVIAAMTSGRATPDQAKAAMEALTAQSNLVEQGEILTRIAQLEELICLANSKK